MTRAWPSEVSFVESFLSFCLSVGSRDQTRVTRPAKKALSPPEPSCWLHLIIFLRFILCMSVLPPCLFVCLSACAPHACPQSTKRGVRPPELESQKGDSCHVHARNHIWVLCKSNKLSKLLSSFWHASSSLILDRISYRIWHCLTWPGWPASEP